ncbi:TonB-dependent receptor [Pseudoduganella lurida]|uniref:TonB-dependent receptor n=1 Tax=Pseudoduganella lurida TaxID=1036180 RepID=A0A562R8Q4_9BURK|nr:TonB-dependent receptor [Pseudoduganella lurida]TWI65417.1 TonB-dependent receptor [Pseudoduganella lurida]
MQNTKYDMRPRPLSFAVSMALAALVTGNAALAQEPAPAGDAPQGPVTTVTVSATRVSAQSSIDRKKNAATAMDSIVAEDVGALPDRNVGEAISRMAGIALDRGDYGEGVSVAVRGNSADLTRVELDGQAVQSAGGADMGGNSGASGRAVEFRQLSSDLIKSVDVVKGSTADMTEGSLGGGIIIKTRTGLDFKKPFVSVRVAGSQGSLNKKWEPDANLILANKYLDGRLGLILNASSTTLANESHSVQNAFSGLQGYYRVADFDNSPEKTFTFQPQTLNLADASATQPMLQTPLLSGGFLTAASPQSVLTQSAAAQTKAACYAAFPDLTTAQRNNIATANLNAALAQRGNELATCLNQWNDYTPSNVRYFVKREIDRRQNLDLRADFKVNNQLTVYAKGSYNRRRDDLSQLTYTLGNVLTNTGTTIGPNYTGPTYTDNTATGVRNAVPGSGYYAYDYPTPRSNGYPLANTVVNIVPGSIVTDANHHLTSYTISDGQATTDQLHDIAYVTAKYLQLGGTYKNDGLTAEFFVGDAQSDFRRAQKRISFTNFFGATQMAVLPNGLWSYSFPTGNFNQADPAQYVKLFPATSNASAQPLGPLNTRYVPAYTAAQQPLVSSSSPRTEAFWNPQIRESEEKTAKLDVSYVAPEWMPFFKRFKAGFNFRDNSVNNWNPGDGNSAGIVMQAAVGTYGQPGYQAPVVIPTPIARAVVQACQDTPGSLGPGGKPCQYGYTPVADPRLGLNSTVQLTPQQWQSLIGQVLQGQATPTQFFSGAKGRSDGMLDNWTQINVEKAFSLLGVPNNNYDCVKTCTATDGKIYEQPVQRLNERTKALYLMGDFGIDHIPFTKIAFPFDWELEGNLGYRYVRTDVNGTGMMTLTSIARTASYDPLDPAKAGGTITNSYVRNTAINASTTDFLPIYNLALWAIPDQLVVRYNHAKTVARPPITQLIASGTCTYDETRLDSGEGAQRCSGTLGNPGLQAQRNVNQNLSVEYYPNRDTMFSVAVFKQKGIVGPAISQGVNNIPLFSGSSLIDPATGVDLSSLPFDYSMWMNGAATTRKGLELAAKSAFTFLPWNLRYTGFDANVTKLRSITTTQNAVDLLTGTPLPPQRESKYSYNWAVWYDDGKFSARVAVQAVASYFTCIAGCTQQAAIQNYPAVSLTSTKFPYNPGSPNFKDGTRFIDGKVAYKWRPNIEFFLEGRNLNNSTTTNSQGGYTPFADGTPNLLDYAYAGRRIMVGVNFRNL